MAYSAFSPAHLAPYLTAGALAGSLSLWPVMFPSLALILLVGSLVAGQALRLPLPGQGGGLLLSDLAVILILAAACTERCLRGSCHRGAIPTPEQFRLSGLIGMTRNTFRNSSGAGSLSTASPAGPRVAPYQWLLVLAPFLMWSLFSLAINIPAYTWAELGISLAYWARLTAYLLLIPALTVLMHNDRRRRLLHRAFVIGLTVLLVAGALQLWVLPDLTVLGAGWDPHPGRLVSTWLDPNFFGAFLLLALVYLVPQLRHYSLHPITYALIGALILTESRSTLLAGGAVAALIIPLLLTTWLARPTNARIVMVTAGAGLLALGAVLGGIALGDRALGLIRPDATVVLRAEALAAVWPLAREHTLLGVGYNAYQFAARDAGLIDNFSIHSRAGADMSLLTLWVTTGLIGVVLFLLPWGVYITRQLTQWLKSRQTYLLIGPAAVAALGFHSLFVNSALYPHLLATLAIIIALTQPRVIPAAEPESSSKNS